MDFGFEVRASDLMGRLGRLKVGGKVLETPYLFPVVHPVRQLISPSTLRSMGFQGLMTNSYILISRRREEVLDRGLHRTLGFDGVLMTDSGGYQVLEYGDLDVDCSEIARFQADIGSELAVTLDRPTGFSNSRQYARGTMEYSLKNALATIKEYGGRKTVWVGPIQGGLFTKLLAKSARSLVGGGFRFLALGSPVQVMENYRFPELVNMIVAARRAIPYSVPLHLFGAGHPLTMAMSVALGCDTFDSASYILFARDGRYMTERGVSRIESMGYLPCSCPVCAGTTVAELLEMEWAGRTEALATHNLHILRKEVEACKEAILEGRLWDLVREKAVSHPKLYAALANFTEARDLFEGGTPPLKDRGLFVRDQVDMERPEIRRAQARLPHVLVRRSQTAVVLFGEVPPLLRRPRALSDVPQGADVYGVNPALGLYPAELAFVYPFTQTVAHETSEGDFRESAERLWKMGYSRVMAGAAGSNGRTSLRVMNRRSRTGSSPSARSSSARPRSPRRP